MLYSGRYFDFDRLTDEPPVDLIDLASVCGVCRFGGALLRTVFVDEHSFRVGRFAAVLAQLRGLRPVDCLLARAWGELHDAHEALVPWGDCLTPGKTPEMRAREHKLDEFIRCSLGLPKELPSAVAEVVHDADRAACYFEATRWQPHGRDWASSVISDALRMQPNCEAAEVDILTEFVGPLASDHVECDLETRRKNFVSRVRSAIDEWQAATLRHQARMCPLSQLPWA